MAEETSQPLVSVGIPTYNRPEGLQRTLDCICNQTYRNLEIILSDNGSTDDEMRRIGESFASRDPRVRYHRQPENQGVEFNFKFVLENATGEFFMWAADDDEWDPRFVETCVKNSANVTSVMTGISIVNRHSKTEETAHLPEISPAQSAYLSMRNHLLNLTPALFYALHRRNANAGEHDLLFQAHARRSDRCRQCRIRRHRCGDA